MMPRRRETKFRKANFVCSTHVGTVRCLGWQNFSIVETSTAVALVVACPLCNKTFNVKEKYLGKTGGCPHCHGQIAIPKSDSDEETLFASDDESKTDYHPSRPKPPQRREPAPQKIPVKKARSLPLDDVTDTLEEQSLSVPYNTLVAGPIVVRKNNNAMWVKLGFAAAAVLIIAFVFTIGFSSGKDAAEGIPKVVPASALGAVENADIAQVKFLKEHRDITVEMVLLLRKVDDAESAEAAVEEYTEALRRQIICARAYLRIPLDEEDDPSSIAGKELIDETSRAEAALNAEKARIWQIPAAAQVLQAAGERDTAEFNSVLRQIERRYPNLKFQ